jgi:hypothetical protein
MLKIDLDHRKLFKESLDDSQHVIKAQDTVKLEGIPLDFFSENCLFTHLILDDVKERLFQALGIDTKKKNAIINWDLFVELYCIVELGQLNESKMI